MPNSPIEQRQHSTSIFGQKAGKPRRRRRSVGSFDARRGTNEESVGGRRGETEDGVVLDRIGVCVTIRGQIERIQFLFISKHDLLIAKAKMSV